MTSVRTRRFPLPLLLGLAACVETTAPPIDPTVTGYWLGTSQGLLIALDLVEENGQVVGTGTVMEGVPIEFTVHEGNHSYPDLFLVGDPRPRYSAFRLIGRVSANRIAATLEGSGFRDFDVHLARW